MPAVCLHDQSQIEAFLRQNIPLNLYAIGDLDPLYWPQTTWYGWLDQHDVLGAVGLVYSGLELPCLLALCDESSADAARLLLREVRHLLPPRFYCHLSEPLMPILAESFTLEPQGTHLKMILADQVMLHDVDTSGAMLLTRADLADIQELYADSYPGNWFEPQVLDLGSYFGLRIDGRLVTIAGVHVYSPTQRVAALGNITTHPEARGRGHGRRVTAALVRRLLEDCEQVGLNVKADNTPAIRCYAGLGFRQIAQYEECAAIARTDRRQA